MVACEKDLEVGEDVGFEQEALQGRTDLLLDVVVIVHGEVLLQNPDRVLGVLIIF